MFYTLHERRYVNNCKTDHLSSEIEAKEPSKKRSLCTRV